MGISFLKEPIAKWKHQLRQNKIESGRMYHQYLKDQK